MRRVKVKLLPRKPGRKSDLKRKRREGWLPVEIYGKGVENKHAWINVKDFASLPHGEAFLIEAELDGETRVCLLKDIQFGWLGNNPIHIDLYDLSNVEEIEVEVPIEFVGTPAGVEAGGTFEPVMHTLTIKAPPAKIPEKIVVDVSGLGLGEALHVRDITPPEGCMILDNPEETVAVVYEPEEEVIGEEETGAEETGETEATS
uniref:Large ribosomal subunit protein bL25 n=1 Tax=Aquifex aeolicus TaxID=63363 RepID=B5TB45_AQUAO|nr:5S rRNA-binding protein [Aquifex aeolicus]